MFLFRDYFKYCYLEFIKNVKPEELDINQFNVNIRCKDGFEFKLLINKKNTLRNEIDYKSIKYFDIIVDSLITTNLEPFLKGNLLDIYEESSQFYYEEIPIGMLETFISRCHQGILYINGRVIENKEEIHNKISIDNCEEILSIAKIMIDDKESLKYLKLISKELGIDFEKL